MVKANTMVRMTLVALWTEYNNRAWVLYAVGKRRRLQSLQNMGGVKTHDLAPNLQYCIWFVPGLVEW